MRSFKLLPLLVFVSFAATAQTGVEAMIGAEKSFAAFSVAHGTKEAFLQYIDSNSLMFDNGKPVKAQEYWRAREKSTGVLDWHPAFAEISASGDLGFTTGPWTYRANAGDTVLARGQFATVWYRNGDGDWKFLIDLGVDDTPADTSRTTTIFDYPKKPENIAAVAHVFPMVAAENGYTAACAKSKYQESRKYISTKSILCRNKKAPAVSPADQQDLINHTPSSLRYKMEGWNISSTPDLGYTYGTVFVSGKSGSYFRVWRREKEGWKIALEILRY